MRPIHAAACAAAGLCLLPLPLAAQASGPSAAAAQDPVPADQGRRELTPKELRQELERLEREHGEQLEDLRFHVETLEEQLAGSQAAARGPQAQRQNVFNPQITVFGNFLGRSDDRRVFLEDDPAEPRIDDRFLLREVELDFRAPIDPWADGVLIAAFAQESAGEFEAEIEEGYVLFKRLPFFDAAPGGLKVTGGRFRPQFGRLNQIHLHDLPQITYPRSLETFLGEEGYIQEGFSGRFFLPSPGERTTLEASVAVLDGGEIPLTDGSEASDLSVLGHVQGFREIGSEHTVEVGLSAWGQDTDHVLYGADATYKWKPLAGGEWRSFLVGGEVFAADLDDPDLARSPLGFYLWSQYQLDKRTYVGVRYDRSQELEDEDLVTDTYGAFLTYYTTEFLRLRLGLEHAESDLAMVDGRDTVFLELNFVFGSHPVEPYWVNR